jgi:rifampicin phosphotransferase
MTLDQADAQYTWNRGQGPLARLYQDVQRAYYEGNRRCWEAVAAPMVREHIMQIVDGWAYHRGPDFDENAKARLRKHQEHVLTFRARKANWYVDELRPQVVEIIERLRKHPRPTRPLPVLVEHLEDCIEAQAHIMGNLHWRLAAGIMSPEGPPRFNWPQVYTEITGRSEAEAPTLVGGITNELTRTIRRMRRLARLVKTDPDLLRAVEADDREAIERDDRPAFKSFRSGFRSLLRRYGHRTGAGWGSSSGIGSPTWNLRPDLPLRMIATYARADLDEVDRKEREANRERKRLLRDVRRGLKSDPDKLARFEWEFSFATRAAWVIEDHNDWMDQSAPGILRDAMHVVGLRLVGDGVIDDPEDVVHLSLDELRSPPNDARALVDERKREFERLKDAGEPPEQIGVVNPALGGRVIMHDEGEGHVGNELRGLAASSGKYTGRARVFMPSPIPPDVDDGDILVAVDAGPDWTPLFAILGAVVLDKGTTWQHAAVMAREFGIPGVTGTVDGTSVIKDGQTITVDGGTGIVELG